MLGLFAKKQSFTPHHFSIDESGRVNSTKSGAGFTLIELLVVLAIIGLLVSIVAVALGGPQKEARDARRQIDIQQIMKAMDLCYDDSDCGAGANQYISTTGGANAVTAIGTYMPSVPIDPVDNSPYQYTWIDNSGLPLISKYCLYTKLEAPATDTWIAASHQGTNMNLDTPPSTPDCW